MKKRVLVLLILSIMTTSIYSKNQMSCIKVKAEDQKVDTAIMPTPTPTPSGGYRIDFWDDSSRIKTSGNYQYHVLSEEKKMITITKIKNAKDKLTIPKEIDGYKVVGIGKADKLPLELKIDEAKCEYIDFGSDEMSVLPDSSVGVTEVTVPKYIQFVGISAFENSKNLEKIKIDKRNEKLYIHYEAFTKCKKLKSVNIPEKVYVRGAVFSNCGKIDQVTIGTSVRQSDSIFYGTDIKLLKIENKKKSYDISDIKNLKISTVYIGGNVKKLVMKRKNIKYRKGELTEINKLLVENKNTVIEGWDRKHQFLRKLYTVSGAKAVKWAKKNKIAYKVINRKNKSNFLDFN